MDAIEKFERLAQVMYLNIWVVPEGFPNGLPTWDELPENPTEALGVQGCKSFWREAAMDTVKAIIAIEGEFKKTDDNVVSFPTH